MAPLVPDMISPEFDFVIAFIMGIGFGYVLEQAGFSSTRKLVGLFYGYDFTVLKVFFTAGVTAMIGVLFFGHIGLLNLEMIYINPMFVWSAVIGGLIMGAGFIMGGFCPGTSLCALAVGRIDALFFIIGSVGGILLFTEFYPAFEELYKAWNIGAPKINDVLGMSEEAFGLLLTLVAIGAFVGTSWIQDKVKGETTVITASLKRNYTIAAVAPVLIILLIWITPSKEERLLSTVESRFENNDFEGIRTMNIDKLAFELMYHAHLYNVIDVTETDSLPESIPTSMHIKLSELRKPQFLNIIKQQYKTNVFVSSNKATAEKEAILAEEIGDKNPVIFTETVSNFRTLIFSVEAPPKGANKAMIDQYRFYMNANIHLKKMEERLKNLMEPPKKEVRKAKGGCA